MEINKVLQVERETETERERERCLFFLLFQRHPSHVDSFFSQRGAEKIFAEVIAK
jgi:hypothetical protein